MTTHAFLSAPVFDIYGYVALPLMPSAGERVARRSSRIATLDGGAVLNDGGFSEGDRELMLRWPADRWRDQVVEYLVRFYPRFVLAWEGGCYEVAPGAFQRRERADISRLQLLILRRLSE